MLTIEELKALKVGEWVWIKIFNMQDMGHLKPEGYYKKVKSKGWYEEQYFRWEDIGNIDNADGLTYESYGRYWLAYKNKEEAEGKSITLPYLLCTSSKFACVIWRDKDGKVHKTYTMPIDEAKGVLKEKERICHTNE